MAGPLASIDWPCTHCDVKVPLPVTIASSETIYDARGKATGVHLTPHVDTTAAYAHLVDAHLVVEP